MKSCASICKSAAAVQNPGVAKFGIALEWGSRGLEFESRHSDQKAETVSTVSAFFFSNERFEHLNASVRGTLACRQLDGGNTIIILPSGKNNANESRHSDHLPMESWIHGSIGIFVFKD